MRTVLKMKHGNQVQLPAKYQQDDVRSSDGLVQHFIAQYTKPQEKVFDPFAGFGTTLLVAESLGRQGFGLEYLEDRADYIRSVIQSKEHVRCGSALALDTMAWPVMDFSFTSPPYMSKNNHKEYPFAAYQVTGDGYQQYLQDIQHVYRQLSAILKPNAYAVMEISNIINDGIMTPLAWDVALSVGEVLVLEQEMIVAWEGPSDAGNYGFGYDHCYCLLFRNSAPYMQPHKPL